MVGLGGHRSVGAAQGRRAGRVLTLSPTRAQAKVSASRGQGEKEGAQAVQVRVRVKVGTQQQGSMFVDGAAGVWCMPSQQDKAAHVAKSWCRGSCPA